MISKPISKQPRAIETIVLLSAWIIGNLWTYLWFIKSLRYTSQLNLIILGLGFTALIVQLIRSNFGSEFWTLQFRLYPVLLMLGAESSAIILKWSINIPQLTLLCFILGSYGLLGLFMPLATWRKGMTLAVISACLVPFLVAFNSGLGFPVRVLTAHAVAQTLAEFHLSAASSHDIIVMENGIAQVDFPCSGMKSLWTGTVFLLGATWLERRQLGFRWLLVAIANLSFLILANIARVLILVMLIEVWQLKQIADILHLPLGVVGFVLASFATWVILQKVPQHSSQVFITPENQKNQKSNLNWLLSIVIVLGVVGQLQPLQLNHSKITSIDLPSEITTENLALSAAEANFFSNSANPLVQKLSFKSDQLSGSMLMVVSDTWQAHHPPELCFTGNGFKVDSMNSQLINDSIDARWLSLQDGQLSAAYWFQSAETTTNDFVSRIWEHISHRDKTWVLVSILYDEAENPDSLAIKNFSNSIYQTIDRSFNS